MAATLITSSTIKHESRRAALESGAATLTAELDLNVHEVEAYLDRLESGAALELPAALSVDDELDALVDGTSRLTEVSDLPVANELHAQALTLKETFHSFFETGGQAEAARAREALLALDQNLEPVQQQFSEAADQDRSALRSATNSARATVIGITIGSVIIASLLSFVIGRRLSRSLKEATAERDHLATVTTVMNRRNEQFKALYQVVNEVTDNLSMRYVVSTTVEEAAKLVGADYVELRLLQEDSLVSTGTWCSEERYTSAGGVLPLGVGLAGRAAKRGKTLRLDNGAEASMADDERVAGVESGLVVPLIVGARVLGTLACWSAEEGKFDEDDERILELMAAQVASAVAAANLHETSERKALHDVLTGLPNRRQMIEDSAAIERSLDLGQPMAVVMLDIDHFKRFNDEFGHRVGDVTLQKVAEVMRSVVRETDRIYRYGGEEFVVVFDDVDQAQAMQLAERLRQMVAKTPLTGESLEPVGPVTVSAGIALAPQNSQRLNELLRLADDALYESKEAGRNRITLANGALHEGRRDSKMVQRAYVW